MPNKVLAALLCAAMVSFQPCDVRAQNDDDEEEAPKERPVDLLDSGRLLATGGVSQIEGAGGGGLAPWALITGYGTRDAIGANAHYTFINLPGYRLHSVGGAIGLFDRVELSYAHQWFDTGSTGGKLGLGNGFTFQQEVFGAKLRLFGNAIFDQDTWLPQVAVGLQYKRNNQPAVLSAIGARDSEGVDFYASATKLFLDQSVLANVTVRMTRANQTGILGFGGDRNDAYQPQFEGSLAYLFSRNLAFGAEYRTKPDNLGFAREDNWFDVFAAYFINKNVSATLAFVGLGDIATQKNQNGVYLSLQAGF
jgi:hypothetical protein